MLDKLKPRMLQERGDTIVEVMIVLAVLGLAIGISYATANRALLQARQAQENTKATQLLQSQIEQLTTMTANKSTNPNYIFGAGPYCVSNQAVVTGAACRGVDTYYDIDITQAGNLFTLTAKWDDVAGEGNDQGKDTVTLMYRLYPS
ncbi:MAG: type II secretion system protein [Patescibacteria group bacterium]